MLTTAQKTRVALVIMGFAMVTLALWARLIWVQVLSPSHWVTLARRQHLQVVELASTRGRILDRHLKPLAVSIRLTSVFADPRHVKNPARTARLLSPLVRRPVEELQAKLSQRDRGFVWLARRIPSPQTASQIQALHLAGIETIMEPQRVYPQGYLASHVIGFAGMDAKGLEGLEMVYDRLLKGEPGWRWLTRDARRRPVDGFQAPVVAPRDGLELVLTLDNTLQYIAEQELDRVFRQTKAKGATLVLLDPMTGEILALANRPTFDPNQLDVPPDTRRNRAVTDTFEPGSVFKIVTAATAVAKKVVRPEETFYCEQGAFPVAGHVLHDHKPHGWLTFREVVTLSSNIGTAKVAMRVGPQALYQGIQAFGFGLPTGCGFPGEVSGTVRPTHQWSKLSITAIPMGQEVAVTALQLAQAVCVVANGGLLMKPWVVREIRDPAGAVVERFKPTVVRRVISPEVAQTLKEILAGVVEEGTGKLAAVPGFRAAGKTGTGQKVEPNGLYSHSRFVASFIGFVPVENPRLAMVVVVDEPRPFYYGGVVAAPVFRQVAAEALAYLNVNEQPLRTALAHE